MQYIQYFFNSSPFSIKIEKSNLRDFEQIEGNYFFPPIHLKNHFYPGRNSNKSLLEFQNLRKSHDN